MFDYNASNINATKADFLSLYSLPDNTSFMLYYQLILDDETIFKISIDVTVLKIDAVIDLITFLDSSTKLTITTTTIGNTRVVIDFGSQSIEEILLLKSGTNTYTIDQVLKSSDETVASVHIFNGIISNIGVSFLEKPESSNWEFVAMAVMVFITLAVMLLSKIPCYKLKK